MTRWRRLVSAYVRETRGAAAVEFAMWLVMLAVPIFGVVDLSFYVYQKMQVQNAAQAAAQNAWATCNSSSLWPATSKCGTSPLGATLNAAILSGAHSTSLGSLVKVQAGSEGYYCTNASGVLTLVGTAGAINISNNTSSADTAPTKPTPFTCNSVVSGSTVAPGQYVIVNVTYAYSPIFKGASLTALLSPTMTEQVWTRLN